MIVRIEKLLISGDACAIEVLATSAADGMSKAQIGLNCKCVRFQVSCKTCQLWKSISSKWIIISRHVSQTLTEVGVAVTVCGWVTKAQSTGFNRLEFNLVASTWLLNIHCHRPMHKKHRNQYINILYHCFSYSLYLLLSFLIIASKSALAALKSVSKP